jgi:WhiB family redox-sensing transcriptional regulator
MDAALFFPEPTDDQTVAKGLCASCPVRDQCLAFGLREGEGIWGGANGRDRRKLRAAMRSSAA